VFVLSSHQIESGFVGALAWCGSTRAWFSGSSWRMRSVVRPNDGKPAKARLREYGLVVYGDQVKSHGYVIGSD
jgi:hypothetical protein